VKNPLAVAVLCVVASGCDVRRPWPPLEPGLERMMVQPRVAAYTESDFFADGVSMRPLPFGVVAYRSSVPDGRPLAMPLSLPGQSPAYPDDIRRIPIPVDRRLLLYGRQRFEIVCATCHGVLGDGQSPVADRMALRRPPSLHDARIRAFTVGRLYGIIEHGFGLMPSYGEVLDYRDRWAIVGYVQALQLSRHAAIEDVPLEARQELERRPP